MKIFLLAIALMAGNLLKAQKSDLFIVDELAGQTEDCVRAFIRGYTRGLMPIMQKQANLNSYDIDTPLIHVEYKTFKDTCVMAAIRFKTPSGFNLCLNELKEVSEDLGSLRLKVSSGGQIFYTIDQSGATIAAITKKFAKYINDHPEMASFR